MFTFYKLLIIRGLYEPMFSLSECIDRFVVLNVGMKVFKQVQVDTYNADNDKAMIDA